MGHTPRFEAIELEIRGQVGRVTLSRPETLNALMPALGRELLWPSNIRPEIRSAPAPAGSGGIGLTIDGGTRALLKRTLNAAAYPRLEEILELEAELQQQRAGSKDFAERAFLEKRPAELTGK